MGVCKQCGKQTLGTYEYCLNCRPKSNNPAPTGSYSGGHRGGPSHGLPPECIFKDSFYASDGYLRKEIFMDAAEKMYLVFQSERITQTSIRHLFNMLKSVEMRLKADRDLPLGFVRENFFKFVTHTVYQTNRGILSPLFKEFIERHADLAVKEKKEFRGFVEYLTSIVARMKQK